MSTQHTIGNRQAMRHKSFEDDDLQIEKISSLRKTSDVDDFYDHEAIPIEESIHTEKIPSTEEDVSEEESLDLTAASHTVVDTDRPSSTTRKRKAIMLPLVATNSAEASIVKAKTLVFPTVHNDTSISTVDNDASISSDEEEYVLQVTTPTISEIGSREAGMAPTWPVVPSSAVSSSSSILTSVELQLDQYRQENQKLVSQLSHQCELERNYLRKQNELLTAQLLHQTTMTQEVLDCIFNNCSEI